MLFCVLLLIFNFFITIHGIQIKSVYNDPVMSVWLGFNDFGYVTPGCNEIPLNTIYHGPLAGGYTTAFYQNFECNHYSRVIISYTEAYGCGQNADQDFIRLSIDSNVIKQNNVSTFINSNYCNIATQNKGCGTFLIHYETVDIGYREAHDVFEVRFAYVFLGIYFFSFDKIIIVG